MRSKNRKSLKKRGKLATAALVAIPLLALGGGAYWLSQDEETPAEETVQTEDGVKLSPPTKEEVKATEQYKQSLSDQTRTPASSSSTSVSTKAAKPLITSYGVYNGAVEVGARVPGVFESSGTCTLRLSKGGTVVSKSQKAVQNVSEMSCGFITISTSKLSSGSWSATVSYKSTKYSGQSDPVTIRVP